jgi:N-acetylmuramic acid 6-phosphate etherase
MIRLGKVYSNLMVDVQASNQKLVERAKRIVCLATGVSREQAEKALASAGGSAKIAITMLLLNITADEASHLLEQAKGFVSGALALYTSKTI